MTDRPAPGGTITRQERIVIAGIARGHSTAQIARHLDISRFTIKSHLVRAGGRLGVRNRAGIVGAAYRTGILAGLKPEPHRPVQLQPREAQVLFGMAYGLDNLTIGMELGLAEDTVKTYAKRLFRKLGAEDRAHAVALGYQHGYLPLPQQALGRAA